MREPVRLRPSPPQFLAFPLFAVVLFVVSALLPPYRMQWLLFPVAALLMIPQAYGVKLTDQHLTYLRLLGPQRLRWDSIRDMEVRPAATSTGVIVITRFSADRLVTPRQGWVLKDRDFDRKLELLRSWWVDQRGPGWNPHL